MFICQNAGCGSAPGRICIFDCLDVAAAWSVGGEEGGDLRFISRFLFYSFCFFPRSTGFDLPLLFFKQCFCLLFFVKKALEFPHVTRSTVVWSSGVISIGRSTDAEN